MSLDAVLEADTYDMARKKKPVSGDRKTPRVVISLAEDWHAVLRKLAAKRKQPAIYVVVDLIKSAAELEGIMDLPAPPWEKSDDE